MKRGLSEYDAQRKRLAARLTGTQGMICGVRLYLKHIYAVKHFSFGSWSSRQHVIVAIEAAGKIGFAESILSVNRPDATLDDWKEKAAMLPGLHAGQAVAEVRGQQGSWPEQLVEMLEMALIDLCGKIKGIPANHLLGLCETHPVFGVHVILSDNMDEVAESAQWAKANHKSRFIKVKLFGREDLDCKVIRTVRSICPPQETYLIGDVNCGYRRENASVTLAEIARHLHALHNAGLDACEDPAFLQQQDWVELQQMAAPLELIPDYPMRPSRRAVQEICAGMGAIYNIHPDSAGSIIDAILLAGRIRELGAGLMIGDDSLVGPSATIWQQLASGLNARWVEATEKRNESDFYYRSIRSMATDSADDPITVDLKPGFGIEIDEKKLALETDQMAVIGI